MKKALSTKEKILLVAKTLFSERGYNKTPISEIIDRANISKGGFYHHFKSKEEILDQLATLQVDAVVQLIDQISQKPGKTALEKFRLVIEEVLAFRNQNRDQMYKMYEGFLNKENLVLRDKINTYTLENALPPYPRIVHQGINEGAFNTIAPEIAVETIIRVAPEIRMKMAKLYLDKTDNEHYAEELARVADYLEEFVHRILGAREGGLPISILFKSFFLNN